MYYVIAVLTVVCVLVMSGCSGSTGSRGPEGLPGVAGVQGVPGQDGEDGQDGMDGKDGMDAPSYHSLLFQHLNNSRDITGDGQTYQEAFSSRLDDAITNPESGTQPVRFNVQKDAITLNIGDVVGQDLYKLGTLKGEGRDGVPKLGPYQGYRLAGSLVRQETHPRVMAYASVYSDQAAPNDGDYLSFGVWAAVPENPETEQDFQIGAFGSKAPNRIPRKTLGQLVQVAGPAIYMGNATGIRKDGQALSYFDANVELTAEFGNEMTMGTIRGVVNAFRDKVGVSLNIKDVVLNRTMIDGVFTGVSSQGEETGSWKGAFVGMNDAGQPTGVSGTFGVGDVIGAFGARE